MGAVHNMKPESKRAIPLAVIRILEEHTDTNNALEMSELKELLESKYGISADRRTLYATVKLLNEFGYDICFGHPYEGSLRRGYYLASRGFNEDDCVDALKAVKHSKDFTHISEDFLKHFSKYQKLNIKSIIK